MFLKSLESEGRGEGDKNGRKKGKVKSRNRYKGPMDKVNMNLGFNNYMLI